MIKMQPTTHSAKLCYGGVCTQRTSIPRQICVREHVCQRMCSEFRGRTRLPILLCASLYIKGIIDFDSGLISKALMSTVRDGPLDSTTMPVCSEKGTTQTISTTLTEIIYVPSFCSFKYLPLSFKMKRDALGKRREGHAQCVRAHTCRKIKHAHQGWLPAERAL